MGYLHQNLACDKLLIKVMRNSFIHRFIHLTHDYRALKTHLTHIKCVDKWNANVWMDKSHTNFTYSYKSMYQMCFQCMILMCQNVLMWEWTNLVQFPLLSSEMLNLWCKGCIKVAYVT